MKYSKSLFIYDIDVSSLRLKEEGKIGISSKNSIVHASKSFAIFLIDPLPFSLLSKLIGFCHNLPVELLKKIFDYLMIVVIRCDMKNSRVLVIDYLINLRDKFLTELFCLLLIETLDCLEEFLLFCVCHYNNCWRTANRL